jgi:phosphatidylserine/phosphatidylglycerophosphate/cardiolipin synthase-like enzyme
VIGAALLFPISVVFGLAPFELVLTVPKGTALSNASLRPPAEVWAEMIDRAEKSIDVAEFYIAHERGRALEPILARFAKASSRGVRMRFLFEKKMEANDRAGLEVLSKLANAEVRMIDFGALEPGGILHAKYFVVDGKAAYLGSQNLDWRSLEHIHELGVAIHEGAIASELARIFAADWAAAKLLDSRGGAAAARRHLAGSARSGGREVRWASGSKRAELVASPSSLNPPGIRDSEKALVAFIEHATQAIDVQVLEYCPLDYPKQHAYPVIDSALRKAAGDGVEVRLLVSSWNAEPPCIQWVKSLAVLPHVSVKIASIPEAREGFIPYARVIHSKYAVVDRRTLWVGTSNFAGGYLDRSRNVELVLEDAELAEKAERVFADLWDSSYAEAVDACRTYEAPRKR